MKCHHAPCLQCCAETAHSSGLCKTCRTTTCADCGIQFYWKRRATRYCAAHQDIRIRHHTRPGTKKKNKEIA